ncbi:uncharacterized protein UTRI_03469_B [Ustilago trichophora]|uniref:Eukaryotic translation initiation factor 4E binding protein n=1 Tax=Ustilago trichophora TaxID=86804 RepID=A0A5C3E1T3_9BASI|nr:uncharacterized protein UTRI_03469_B [Ustilago trichophora]
MSTQIPIRNTSSSNNPSTTTSVYGTTPGGTPRIHYSRDQLLSLASSPLSRSPPGPPGFTLPAAISRSPKVGSAQERFQPPTSNPNITHLERRLSIDEETFKLDL